MQKLVLIFLVILVVVGSISPTYGDNSKIRRVMDDMLKELRENARNSDDEALVNAIESEMNKKLG